MQGSRQFGLVQVKEDANSPDGYSIFSVGCCMEIEQCETLPDGRSLIQTVATKRFKIIERSMTDGYWVAKIDIIPENIPSNEEEFNILKEIISRIQKLGNQSLVQNTANPNFSKIKDLIDSFGNYDLNTINGCCLFASRACSVLPISPQLKQPLLEMNSPTERLTRIISLLERLVSTQNCSIL